MPCPTRRSSCFSFPLIHLARGFAFLSAFVCIIRTRRSESPRSHSRMIHGCEAAEIDLRHGKSAERAARNKPRNEILSLPLSEDLPAIRYVRADMRLLLPAGKSCRLLSSKYHCTPTRCTVRRNKVQGTAGSPRERIASDRNAPKSD